MYAFLTLFGTIIHQSFSVYANTWLSEWSGHPDANEPEIRDLYLGVYGALGVAQGLSLFATSIAMAIGCLNAARFLHHNLLHRTLRLPMEFFDTTPLGRILNRYKLTLLRRVNSLVIFFFLDLQKMLMLLIAFCHKLSVPGLLCFLL